MWLGRQKGFKVVTQSAGLSSTA